MDNMLVKSKRAESHLNDKILRKYLMRLNQAKSIFRVLSDKFLGFMVSQRGIKANPEKVKAILDMTSPKSVKEVKRLTGQIVALNRFIFRATDKYLPFCKILKQAF